MNTSFFVESNLVKANCRVMTPDFMFIDSVYPYSDITLFVNNERQDEEFGDNAYTRQLALDEMEKLKVMVRKVKRFYPRYVAVFKHYTEIENMENDRFDQKNFANSEERGKYQLEMHERLRRIYIHYLQRAIPEAPIADGSLLVIQPYLLNQILNHLNKNK